MSRPWRTIEDVRAAVLRHWKDGSLLRAHALGEPFPTVEVPLGGPTASQIEARWAEVRQWATSLSSSSQDETLYELQHRAVGGRTVGRNSLPHRAVVAHYEQAWALLKVSAEVQVFERLLESTTAQACRQWALDHPLKTIDLANQWGRLLAAYQWLADSRDSGRYLRQIDAPGVDTKFVESHRGVLSSMLGAPVSKGALEQELGLSVKPSYVRLRLDPRVGPTAGVSELSVRTEELPALNLQCETVLMVENEITYLTVPVPPGGAVVWGKGFEAQRTQVLAEFSETPVYYWGDLDTHGFAILHGVRAALPQTQSVLMDRQTLLEHRSRWGVEPSPTAARLSRLTPAENSVYEDLVSGRYADRLRLEQERIDWSWALERLRWGADRLTPVADSR